ncbi:unnamed protein product [Caenorhabditis bovis]|uniref:Peptidase metallopeptidase domain-containing protein n=1 Tax=Caenorhabditis bovis TaxID=2654633 RepID=A0A8S1EFS9_9PELO|nr:unnamed protein product [Caenorhabditis bovis]
MSLSQQRAVFSKAFATWEEHTQLRFVRLDNSMKDANIDIIFASKNHDDGEPFDGNGNILAHAFFPRYGGDIHFDEDEYWSADKSKGVDLYAVAVHEIGHALGLKHSSNYLAIMAPFYKQYTGAKLHLHFDDILAIKQLYGKNDIGKKFEVNEKQWRKEICENPYLDAITRLKNGTILAFRKNVVFEMLPSGKVQNPKIILELFPFEGPIDAATTDKNGNIYVFKGNEYWVLNRHGNSVPNYPKKIRDGLNSLPDTLGAALYRNDGKPFFFKRLPKRARCGVPI